MENLSNNIKKHFDTLQGQEMYFVSDIRNMEFFEKNPLNNDKETIKNKISAINHGDIKKLGAVDVMADHILKLNIDKKLNSNDLSVVEDIADIKFNGTPYRLLNFASIYCNYHKPDIYPIFSDQHLDLFKEYIRKNNLKIKTEDLNKYLVRKEILDDIIRKNFAGKDLNYFQARKFGWLHLDKVLSESSTLDVK